MATTCNFCSKKNSQNDSIANEFNAIIIDNKLFVDYDAYSSDSSFSEVIEIKFCPMCGKSLL